MTLLIYMAVIAVAACGVYFVKYSVQDMQRKVAALEEQLQQEQQALHLLRAEWAYLNRPERLSRLAADHLKMVPVAATSLTTLAAIPAAQIQEKQQNSLPSASESTLLYRPAGGY
jgi:cell division protein FtsL